MENHSFRKVILKTESDGWSLQEEGLSVQYLPYRWSRSFDISDICLISSLKVENRYARGEETSEVTEKEIIVATLVPGGGCAEKYFVFGANRPLSDIRLCIEAIDDNQIELGIAEGHEGYVGGGNGDWAKNPDLKNKTIPYTLSFTLYLKRSHFAHYASRIREKSLDAASLNIWGVEGFYSGSFFEIFPDSITILPHGEQHLVEMPESCRIEAPRLGKIRGFEIDTNTVLQIAKPSEPKIDDAVTGKKKSNNPVQILALSDHKALDLLRALRLFAWVILVLLVLILFRNR